jgi:hypothetical protein
VGGEFLITQESEETFGSFEVARSALRLGSGYHPTILAALRGHSGRDENTTPPTSDFALLQDQLAKLVALVDLYYCAYRETLGLLGRRERELADLRGKLNSRPAALRR